MCIYIYIIIYIYIYIYIPPRIRSLLYAQFTE